MPPAMARREHSVYDTEMLAGGAELSLLEHGAGREQGSADRAQRPALAPKLPGRTGVVEEPDQSRRPLVEGTLAGRQRVAYGEVGGLGLQRRVEEQRLVRPRKLIGGTTSSQVRESSIPQSVTALQPGTAMHAPTTSP